MKVIVIDLDDMTIFEMESNLVDKNENLKLKGPPQT